jgi:lipoate-protein ligase A
MTAIRLLRDDPLPGAENMARDEALLISVGAGDAPPTLRLYRWCEPTISLGYFQKYAEYEALPPPAGRLPVVRRTTGGGAILHDLELTYSFTLPLVWFAKVPGGSLQSRDRQGAVPPIEYHRASSGTAPEHALLMSGPNALYRLVHNSVADALRALEAIALPAGASDGSGPLRGPFFCFARRHEFDLLVGSDKLVGSAQRRTTRAVLQHGSIVLGNRFAQQPTAVVHVPFPRAIGNLLEHLPRCLSERTGLPIVGGGWTVAERALAADLHAKYAGDEWTRRF